MQLLELPQIDRMNGHTLTSQLPNETVLQLAIHLWPDETRIAIQRLWALGKSNNFSMGDLADLIQRDTSTVSKLFSGTYPAKDLSPITAHITSCLNPESSGSPIKNQKSQIKIPDEIIAEISVVKDIEEICLLAWLKRRIVFIFGPTQSGKTTGLHHFRQHHQTHPNTAKGTVGQVYYTEVPGNGSARSTLNAFARTLGFAGQCNWSEQKTRCFDKITRDDLIIWDEFSQCFNPVTGSVRLATIRLARELWNVKKCGMVFVITDIAKDQMQTGRFHAACDELWYRCVAKLALDRIPSDLDLKLIATAHGLTIPNKGEMDRVRHLIVTGGMTQYTTLLEMANDLAAARGPKEKPSWPDFLMVHDNLLQFSTTRAEKGAK